MAQPALSNLELLAPAGGMAQLRTAVRFGADAVYFAADRFGMRQRAENFTLDAVEDAVRAAHEGGARAYATLNTLMHDAALAALPEYLEALAQAGTDAFIVSDLGAFALAQRYAPNVELHVSTQASVANAEAARMWYEMGASRVVLAREMSLAEVAELRACAPRELELEVFVHGAMCMAVSGRCLISAALTGRSGNKGFCTQPCRWSYGLVEETRPGVVYPIEEDARGTYLMNAQDLNMLSYLRELGDAGVDSIKIEGRNKKSFYVASVVHAYRAVLDGAEPDALQPELEAISHRPYGTGFYFGQPNQSLERDGYLKERIHAATVEGCKPRADGLFDVTAVCHNRFYPGQVMQRLTPGGPLSEVRVGKSLAWLPRDAETGALEAPVPVEVANRTAQLYTFACETSLCEGDFLSVPVEG